MERLTFEKSRAKNIGLALIACALVVASWFTAQNADGNTDRLIGWFGILFFGLGIVIGIKRALEGGIAFVFDRSGIMTEESDVGLIPWFDVESCSIVTIRGTRLLSLTFRDPERFLSRVSPSKRRLASFNERMGWGHWALSFTGVTPGIDDALKFIRQNAPDVQAPSA
jgi:hypothetical protein